MAGSTPEVIISGGPIFSGIAGRFHEAVAITGTRIARAGSLPEILGAAGPDTRRVDLQGRLAMPGVNDCHTHPIYIGLLATEVDLSEVDSVESILVLVAAASARLPRGSWIIGRGYDQSRLREGRHPLAAELDGAAPHHPVYVYRVCSHMGVANSAALALAGITAASGNPERGAVERDAEGQPTGLVQEHAQSLIQARIPPPTSAELQDAILTASRKYLEHGVTSVTDLAVGLRTGMTDYDAYQELIERRALPLRVNLAILAGHGGIIDALIERDCIRPRLGDERARVPCLKFFLDGSASGRTAAMSEPYLGDGSPTGDRGILNYEPAYVVEQIGRYHRLGWQICCHAVGDDGIEQALDAYQAAIESDGNASLRHRIEHATFMRPDQMRRAKRLNVIPVPQPVALWQVGDAYMDLLGAARTEAAAPIHTWHREGLFPAASTDCPVCSPSPTLNLSAMMTRQTRLGLLLSASERLPVDVALQCMTFNGARTSHDEGAKGTLETGMLADIAVLNGDPFTTDPAAMPTIIADLTFVGGKVMHDRWGELQRFGDGPQREVA